jgi:hypothetical protein
MIVRLLAASSWPMAVCFGLLVTAASGQSPTAKIQPPANGQPPIIRHIYIDQLEVFDSTQGDWFFAAPLANSLHSVTRPYIIEDELLLFEGDELDTALQLEVERNLRRTGLFSNVQVSQQSTGSLDSVDLLITAQDRWSLRPAILFGTGGGITNIGAKLEESNFLGTATQITLQGLYRTENDIGWEGYVRVAQRRLFRSEISVEGILQANQFRTDQWLQVYKAYRTTITPWAFGVSAQNSFGKDFAYANGEAPYLLPFHVRDFRGWASQSYGEGDLLYVSAAVDVNSVQRTVPESRQAFDNTGHVLVSFSSLRQRYARTAFLDGYETEDILEGGWGNATIGRVFSMGNGGQTMWYIGGDAEQSWLMADNVYVYGHVEGASGFGAASDGTGGTQPLYTTLGVYGLGHWRPTDNMVVAARLSNRTVWNWDAFHQQVLDLESGLRGYPANRLAGDNIAVGNAEFRWFPGWQLWILGLSGVAFYDVGTVWNQGQSLGATRLHHSIGLGFRIHNFRASGSDAIFRFDFAYNLDDKKFSGLIFTTNQLFSAFGRHQYRSPKLYGTGVDVR